MKLIALAMTVLVTTAALILSMIIGIVVMIKGWGLTVDSWSWIIGGGVLQILLVYGMSGITATIKWLTDELD